MCLSVYPQTNAEKMIRREAVAARTMVTCPAKPLARSDRPVIDRLDTDLPLNTNCSTTSPRFCGVCFEVESHYVDQASLEVTDIHKSRPSKCWELKICITTSGFLKSIYLPFLLRFTII